MNVKYAFLTTNVADLRSRPDFRSERLSQLLYGETVRLGGTRLGYCRITQKDGYAGWVNRRFLEPISERCALNHERKINGLVVTLRTPILASSEPNSLSPYFILYGTRLRLVRRRQNLMTCELPNGGRILLSAKSLERLPDTSPKSLSGAELVREAKRFLGVPYLWGGITPLGFDCSGLVRAVFGRLGLHLPRDTKDQIKIGVEIARSEVKSGDLLFFKRHVGIAMNQKRLIHASQGGSGVRVNSLLKGADDYREDLDESFATARRLL